MAERKRFSLRPRSSEELEPREAYARWAERYPPAAHNPLMKLEENCMLELLPRAAVRALDLACGTGRHLDRLEGIAQAAFGIDLSPEMLARAANSGSRLVQGDILSLPFASGSFDLATCGLAVGHVADLGGAVREMARVLAPGGVLLYSDFHPFGALAGWKRSFSLDGRDYTVRHHVHLYEHHHAACRAAGLRIDAVREPRIDFDHPWRGSPAVLVLRVSK